MNQFSRNVTDWNNNTPNRNIQGYVVVNGKLGYSAFGDKYVDHPLESRIFSRKEDAMQYLDGNLDEIIFVREFFNDIDHAEVLPTLDKLANEDFDASFGDIKTEMGDDEYFAEADDPEIDDDLEIYDDNDPKITNDSDYQETIDYHKDDINKAINDLIEVQSLKDDLVDEILDREGNDANIDDIYKRIKVIFKVNIN